MRTVHRIHEALKRVRRLLMRRVTRREPTRRERGVALLIVIVTTAVLGATAADFAYNSQVELEAAVNSRDMLRAEYLAQAGIQLGQLLTAVQNGLSTLLNQIMPGMADAFVITDYAGFLAKAISGDADAREGLGGLIGIDLKTVDGLGTPKGTGIDLTISSEEGKYPINCGGGVNSSATTQANLYNLIYNLVRPQRYDRMFNIADRDGVVITREELPIGVIDWTDIDPLRYNPLGSSSGTEDTYDRGADRYLPHNHYMDTTEELMLVRGISEDFWGAFGELFTVYGAADCKVLASAVEPNEWPLIAAMISASAADKTAAFDPNTLTLAIQITNMLKTGLPALRTMAQQTPFPKCSVTNTSLCPTQANGTNSGSSTTPSSTTQATSTRTTPSTGSDGISMLSDLICSPMINNLPGMSDVLAMMTGQKQAPRVNVPLRPIQMCPGALGQFLRDGSATAGKASRRFYRIDSTGVIERGANGQKITQTHIRGVWDTQRINSNPLCNNHPSCFRGTWLYYRID